ncbi:hypothetical protein [Mucilaginibacter arboris]|uniref:Lipoprotein n=1 Tax=Mucilaginibacter arboris TaxID=2682090 RepID=A0A7K1T1T8_9SPHI|nr:hypothetical protein [Mucilaginibacter arboris]MVN23519.1 hypothetical protein [Mucilaginibacter arboris]
MKVTILMFLSILIYSCNFKKQEQSYNFKKVDSTITHKVIKKSNHTSKNIEVGYSDTYEKLPTLVFDTLSESEFNTLKPAKGINKIDTKQNESFFFIQTALKKHKFKKFKDYGGNEGWSGYDLIGYYPKLKLFAITEISTSDEFSLGELFLLDSLTDYKYKIISFGDGSVETPIPSINNKYLIYYYNYINDDNCSIGILKINDKTNPKNYLKEYASYNSTEFAIENIVWKSDNCFYVKGYNEIYEKKETIKKYKYYQTTFR